MWKAEAIGYAGCAFGRRSLAPPKRPWVAEIIGLSARYGLRRRFLRGDVDFRDVSSSGARGVHMMWVLSPDRVYEAGWSQTWTRREQAFLRVVDGRVRRIEREEVDEWLRRKLNVGHVSAG